MWRYDYTMDMAALYAVPLSTILLRFGLFAHFVPVFPSLQLGVPLCSATLRTWLLIKLLLSLSLHFLVSLVLLYTLGLAAHYSSPSSMLYIWGLAAHCASPFSITGFLVPQCDTTFETWLHCLVL